MIGDVLLNKRGDEVIAASQATWIYCPPVVVPLVLLQTDVRVMRQRLGLQLRMQKLVSKTLECQFNRSSSDWIKRKRKCSVYAREGERDACVCEREERSVQVGPVR